MGSIYRPLARSLGPHTLDWSSETWSKASERATVGLDQIRTRFFYRLRLIYNRSSLMRGPPQGFAIQLCGEPKGSKGGHLDQDKSATPCQLRMSRTHRLQNSSGACRDRAGR